MKTAGFILLGAVIGIMLMIVISVLYAAWGQDDEDYRRQLEEYAEEMDRK